MTYQNPAPASAPYQIVIAAFDGALPSGLHGLLDFFMLANLAFRRAGAVQDRFSVTIASHSAQGIIDGHGRRLPSQSSFAAIERCDAVLVPGFAPNADGLPPRPESLLAATGWLREQHARGAWLCGACSGAFALGEAGLLDGRRCTTTWWLRDELKRRFPKADVAWGAARSEDRRIVTGGGPLSWIDLALHVIRALTGAEGARLAADFAVIDTAQLAQTVYVPQGHVAAGDPFLVLAEQVVRQARDQRLSAGGLAARLATSERTLHRRLKAATGESPQVFIARLRLETARNLLETGRQPIKEIAVQSGYLDEGSFRRAFRRFAGMTPTGYREWSQRRRQEA